MQTNPGFSGGDESVNSGNLKRIQRWCVVRKYNATPDDQYVKIEVANATESLARDISGDVEEYFRNSSGEKLDWWEEETTILQKSLSEFKEELLRFGAFPEITSVDDLIVEEGMVFVYLVDTRIIHFTYQSRRMSETIYNKLLGRVDAGAASEEKQYRRAK